MEANNHTEEIEHEVVSTEIGKPAPVDTIALEVAKMAEPFELTGSVKAREAIAKLKEQYSPLNIAGVDDKAGYEAVRQAIAHTRSLRVAVRDKHKELKEDSLKLGRALDKEKNELISLLEAIEVPLQLKKDDIDLAEKRAKEERERMEQARVQGRVVELMDNGMKYDGLSYVIANIRLDVITLKVMTDDQYGKVLAEVKQENQRILDAEESERKRKAEEAAAIEAQRLENERIQREQAEAQRKLDEARAEIERQKVELEKAKYGQRADRLTNMGFQYNENGSEWVYTVKTEKGWEDIRVTNEFVNDDAMDAYWKELEKQVQDLDMEAERFDAETRKKEQEEKERREAMEAEQRKLAERTLERREQLMEMGMKLIKDTGGYSYEGVPIMTYNMFHGQDEEEWQRTVSLVTAEVAKIKAAKEEEERLRREEQARLDEEERLAGLSMNERVREYVTKLRAVPQPEIKRTKLNSRANRIGDQLDVLTATLRTIEEIVK